MTSTQEDRISPVLSFPCSLLRSRYLGRHATQITQITAAKETGELTEHTESKMIFFTRGLLQSLKDFFVDFAYGR